MAGAPTSVQIVAKIGLPVPSEKSGAAAIERARPAVFAGFSSGKAQCSAALAAEAGCRRRFVFAGCRHADQRRILAVR